jgi:hypothetical protein
LWQVRDLLIELKQQNKIAESERVSKELFKQVTTTIGRSVTRCGEIWLFGYFLFDHYFTFSAKEAVLKHGLLHLF